MKILYDKEYTFSFGEDCKVIIKADSRSEAVNKVLELGRTVNITSFYFIENSIVQEKDYNGEKL